MSEERLEFYIPGRPTYIWYVDPNTGQGKCYRKTDERVYTGTIFNENEVDRTSESRTEHAASKPTGAENWVWVQNSCEECHNPGGIQMISLDWVGSTVVLPTDINDQSIPVGDDTLYTISPIRHGTFDYTGGFGHHVGPALTCAVTTESEVANFAKSFGSVAPIIVGSHPPTAGRVDPLSAADGMYMVENDIHAAVQLSIDQSPVILAGHPDYDYEANPADLFSIYPFHRKDSVSYKNPAVSILVSVIKNFEIGNPQAPTDPRDGKSPTEPPMYQGVEGFFAIDSNPSSKYASSSAFKVMVKCSSDTKIAGKVDLNTETHKLSEGGTSFGASAASFGRPAIAAGAVAGEGVWRKFNTETQLWEDLTEYKSGANYQQIFIRPNAPPLGSTSQWHHNNLPDR